MQEYEIYNAIRSIKRLQREHELLEKSLLMSVDEKSDYGRVLQLDSKISIKCLGHDVWMRHRPVAGEGGMLSYEYEFLAKCYNKDCVFMTLYMNQYGQIFKDRSFKDRFGDADSALLQEAVLRDTCASLLQSEIFAPS